MACPNCGNATTADDVFCASCGTNLAEAPVACANCGKVNEPKAAFCTACGTNLVSGGEPAASAPATAEPEATAPAAAQAPPPPDQPAAAPPPAAGATTAETPFATTPGRAAPIPAAPSVGAPPPAAAPSKESSSTKPDLLPLSLGAAIVAAVGTFIAWFDVFGSSTNAYDIAVQFILDYQTSASSTISIGLVVLVLAGGAAALAAFGLVDGRLWIIRFMGLALFAVAAAFLVQLGQAADSVGASFGDIYGFGPFLTLAGGAGLLAGK